MFVVARVPTVRLKVCQTLLGPLISGGEETPFTFHQSAAGAGQRKVPAVSILFVFHIPNFNVREVFFCLFFFKSCKPHLCFSALEFMDVQGFQRPCLYLVRWVFPGCPWQCQVFEGSSWHKQSPLFYCALHSAPVAQCFVIGLSRYAMATTLAKERAVIVACACRYCIMIVLFSFNNAERLYTCFELSMLSDICCCVFEQQGTSAEFVELLETTSTLLASFLTETFLRLPSPTGTEGDL